MKLRNIKEFNGYWVSDLGDVYSTKSGKQVKLKACKNKKGYLIIKLYNNSKNHNFRIHRLVLMAFDPREFSENYEVNHLDLDKENNKLSNLAWSTGQENIEHAMINGKIKASGYVLKYLELREKVYSAPPTAST